MDLLTPLSQSKNRAVKMYASRLEKLGIFTYQDFLFHLPSRYEDYSLVSKIGQTQIGETVTVKGQVLEMKNQYLRGGRIKTMQKATIADETGSLQLTWFNQPFLVNAIRANSTLAASGKVDYFAKAKTISNPEFELLSDENASSIHTGRLIPIYPETKGVSSKWLRRQVYSLLQLEKLDLEEYMPEKLMKQYRFMNLKDAIKEAHFPKNMDTAMQAIERLAFDELFIMQLAAKKRRETWINLQKAAPLPAEKYRTTIHTFISSLPFKLTSAQQKAVDDILHDIGQEKAMNRLLQGDVGSGKTVVGAVAMYTAFLCGRQSVLMAPTEILAVQHFKTIHTMLEPFGVTVELVTGNKKLKTKSVIPTKAGIQENSGSPIESGMTSSRKDHQNFDILIGTHAVLSEKIQFNNLSLVIIDEQQRFGVEQRSIIRKKGQNTHLLTMTATPIPRTVALTMYGDLDVSYLNEMPVGRKQIKTWLVPPEKRDGAYDWIRKQIKETNSQAFIICPFIEESESMTTIKAASKEYDRLRAEVYTDLRLGLLHGKQKAKEKEAVLQEFKENDFDILVATPVVEVGIDVPNATIIMIEASERFGLAQLHQLRGRVGRGDKQSYCLLFTDSKSALNSERLKGMETLYSGAELAELDLKLRGPGNLYGTAQHGVPKLKVASFSDTELIQKAKKAADDMYKELRMYPLLSEKINLEMEKQVTPD